MRNFFKKIFVFILFLVIVYPLLIFIWGELVPHPYKSNLMYMPNVGMLKSRLQEVEETNEVDILFLGSSHSYRSFDPRMYRDVGLKTFNLGSSRQTHIQTNYLLKKHLEHLNPKLVIYEVFPDIFETEGLESALNIISASDPFDKDLFKMSIEINNLKIYNTYIYKGARDFFGIKDKVETFKEDNFAKNYYVKGGFVERKEKVKEAFEKKGEMRWEPKSDQMDYFEKNINFLRKNNIPFILVITPFKHSFSNEKDIENYLTEFGALYDYNRILKFNSSEDFFDRTHLNMNGVKKLNKDLIEIIKINYTHLFN